MGMYDEFQVPVGCGQVKMYENVLNWFEIGSKVPTEGWPSTHSVYLRNYMWANITNSVYTSCTSEPEHIEMYNKWGYYVDSKGNFIDSGKPSYGE